MAYKTVDGSTGTGGGFRLRRFWLELGLCGVLVIPISALSQSYETADQAPSRGNLYALARSSLEANIFPLVGGSYLAAGQHQFKTLWVRDFCFASRGLFALGREDIVRHQLGTVIANRRPADGLVPRDLDSSDPKSRVMAAVLERVLGIKQDIPLTDPLKPEFVDEHGSPAIDSNALVLLTAYSYLAASGDSAWWNEKLPALAQIYHYYDSVRDGADGLIVQPDFSDWQDSVQRGGKTFYTNLLFYLVTERLAAYPEFRIPSGEPERLRASLELRFFDPASGLFRGLVSAGGEARPYVSLDGNLLALDLGYFKDDPGRAAELYQSLKQSPLWIGGAGMPGFVTYPDYPPDWVSWTVRVGGVGHYHDRIYWSWLIALSAKIARAMGDVEESGRILGALSSLIERDGAVTEIYAPSPDTLPRFESGFYLSETPFSWGAAFVLDLLASAPNP